MIRIETVRERLAGVPGALSRVAPRLEAAREAGGALATLWDPAVHEPGLGRLEAHFALASAVDERELAAALRGADGEGLREAVRRRGMDAFGWYAPFHHVQRHGARPWGIHVRTSGVAYLAVRAFGGLGVPFECKLALAFKALFHHQLFHFATEYVLAQWEALARVACYLPSRRLRPAQHDEREERMANAFALRAFRTGPRGWRAAGATAALRAFCREQPEGYREGPWCASDAAHRLGREELVVPLIAGSARYQGDAAAARLDLEATELYGGFVAGEPVDWRLCPVHVVRDEARVELCLRR
jgi:hypothetical protein